MAGLSLGGIAYVCGTAPARGAGIAASDTPLVVVRERGMPNWPLFEWEQPGGFFAAPPAAVGRSAALSPGAGRAAAPSPDTGGVAVSSPGAGRAAVSSPGAGAGAGAAGAVSSGRGGSAVLSPGVAVMQPPQLVVYGDDTAYADAATLLALPPVWVRTLRDQALRVLTTPADLVRDPEKPPPPDRPVDQVRVRTPAGDFLTVRLAGWQDGDGQDGSAQGDALRAGVRGGGVRGGGVRGGEAPGAGGPDGDPQHAYPPQLHELYQEMRAIRRHVLHHGSPWRPVGVLLGVVSLSHEPPHHRDWPRGLPIPPEQPEGRPYQEIRLPDGPHGLPRATTYAWPAYRLTRNRFVAATWRPLLPHEIT